MRIFGIFSEYLLTFICTEAKMVLKPMKGGLNSWL